MNLLTHNSVQPFVISELVRLPFRARGTRMPRYGSPLLHCSKRRAGSARHRRDNRDRVSIF
jgi:hypothetical protein